MLKFEEVGDVEADADGNMLPGVYSIPGVGFVVVGENKQTLIVTHWDAHQNVYTHFSDIKPWAGSKRLQLVEVRADAKGR